MVGFYAAAMFLTALVGTELLSLGMLTIGVSLVGYGHGFGFFYGIAFLWCCACPVMVGLALYRRPRLTWLGFALVDCAAIALAVSESTNHGWESLKDFASTHTSTIVVWCALIFLLHVSFVLLRTFGGQSGERP